MKKLCVLLSALVLFVAVSYAHPAYRQQKAKAHKKEVKKKEHIKKVPAKTRGRKKIVKDGKKH